MACESSHDVTPEIIENRPALSAIEYRVGTYPSFRRAMLERIARKAAQQDDPLHDWTTRSSDDFGIAFLEMWAYLGDILTFYQERIANEAYLRTTVQKESTSLLVSLIGYRPAPGRAATAYLAFEAEKEATVRLDEGLLVQSVPGQDEKPQKFETVEDVTAHASLNEILPRATVPQELPIGSKRAVLVGTGHQLSPGDWFAIAGDLRRNDSGSERWDLRQITTVTEDKDASTTTVAWTDGLGAYRRGRAPIRPEPDPEFWVFRGQAWPFGYNAPDYKLFTVPLTSEGTTFAADFAKAFPDWNEKYLPEDPVEHPEHLYLDTVYEGIVEGGWVALRTSLIDGTRRPGLKNYREYYELYPVRGVADTAHRNYTMTGKTTRVELDSVTEFTLTIAAQPQADDTITIAGKTYTFQARGGLTNVDGNIEIGTKLKDTHRNIVNAVNVSGTPGSGYAAATTAHPDVRAKRFGTVADPILFAARDSGAKPGSIDREASLSDSRNGFAVRDKPEHIELFPLKGTTVLLQSEKIELAEVPLGYSAVGRAAKLTPVAGNSIELDRVYSDLERDRNLLVTGNTLDENDEMGDFNAEVAVVTSATESAGRTTVELAANLRERYVRSTVVIYGNVAKATHGETVAAEALGDGDAAAEFQTFDLKKSPVTFVPAAGEPGGAASTLTVRVDGVQWHEQTELHGQDGDARVFISRRNADREMRVHFGDGQTGARPTSGRNNIEASYRMGLGPEGNVGARTLRTLLKKPLGLKGVINREPAAGGARPEDAAAVKENAPGTVRTFGRIVSLRDFEDAAREFIGVSKARASFRWDGESRVVDLVVAGDDGVLLDIAESGLQADLDARRDPHQPLNIENYDPVYIRIRLTVTVNRDHVPETVRLAADAALRDLLAFREVDLGQTVYVSDVYAAVQAVAGVVAVDVNTLEFHDPNAPASGSGASAPLPSRLLVEPKQLVRVYRAEDLEVTSAQHETGEGS